MRLSVLIAILVAAQLPSLAATGETITAKEAIEKQLLLQVAFPEYPYEARSRNKTGSGLFELKFSYETGQLREVHVVKSTGNDYLDVRAIQALKAWKAKPRAIHNLLVPVTFEIGKRQ